MKRLGCEIDNAENFKTNFRHPCAHYDIVVFLDACHYGKVNEKYF